MNVDDNHRDRVAYDILSIPTLMVFDEGEVQKKLIGAVPRRRLEDELSTWLRPRPRPAAPPGRGATPATITRADQLLTVQALAEHQVRAERGDGRELRREHRRPRRRAAPAM